MTISDLMQLFGWSKIESIMYVILLIVLLIMLLAFAILDDHDDYDRMY